MGKVARFLDLAPRDRWLVLEASALLMAARAALYVVPFRWVARVVSRPPAARKIDEAASRELVGHVRRAVIVGARHGVGRAVCFPQAIAAQLMLARRGVASTLHFGVAKSAAGEIEAHVWVRAGAAPVVGCEIAERFAPMVSFPRTAEPSPAEPAR